MRVHAADVIKASLSVEPVFEQEFIGDSLFDGKLGAWKFTHIPTEPMEPTTAHQYFDQEEFRFASDTISKRLQVELPQETADGFWNGDCDPDERSVPSCEYWLLRFEDAFYLMIMDP